MRLYIFSILVALCSAPAWASDAQPSIDAPSLMGQPRATVDKALGKPTKCDPSKYGERCTYKGRHEIVFIKGKADWLTLYVDAPMTADALKAVGFRPEPPDNRLGGDLRWNFGMRNPIKTPDSMKELVRPGETLAMPVQSIAAIQGGGGKVSYVYIKTSTP